MGGMGLATMWEGGPSSPVLVFQEKKNLHAVISTVWKKKNLATIPETQIFKWKLTVVKREQILLKMFSNCIRPPKPNSGPNLAHRLSASNLWFVYWRGVKGILADREWESLVANLSVKRKQIKTTTGRSPGLWEGSHSTPPLCGKQPACQGSPATQEHP